MCLGRLEMLLIVLSREKEEGGYGKGLVRFDVSKWIHIGSIWVLDKGGKVDTFRPGQKTVEVVVTSVLFCFEQPFPEGRTFYCT